MTCVIARLAAICMIFTTLPGTAYAMDQDDLTDPTMQSHPFLASMLADDYFPEHLVEKGIALLVALCAEIEAKRPKDEAALFALTHATTEAFNELAIEFEENDSELETGAREAIAGDFAFLLGAYGYQVDLEEAIATRDW